MCSTFLVLSIGRITRWAVVITLCAAPAFAQDDALRYDNGPFINRPGQGPGGTDGSTLQAGMGVFGWPDAQSYQARVADDFSIPVGESWTISRVRLFGYFPLAPTNAGFAGLTLRIWDGQPGSVGSHVIWGDDSTNILTDSAFAGAYRFRDGSPDTLRPIFWVDGAVNTTLGEGTYWLDWAFSGPVGVFGDPHQLPITINGQTTTGNALWSGGPAIDVGPQGFPFQIFAVVPDTTPPRIESIATTPNILWPPNHEMIPVRVLVQAVDNRDPSPIALIKQVTSNEPQDPFVPDWEITGPLTLNLRAERLGKMEGRRYAIAVECKDASDNVSTASVNVTVAHDRK